MAVTSPLKLTVTLTTAAAFSPLLTLPGATGEFLIAIPQIVILSLTASYLVALLVTPAVAVLAFRPSQRKSAEKGNLILRFFTATLRRALQYRWLTVSVAFGILVVVVIASDSLPSQLFPNADKNIIYVDITNDQTDIKDTDQLTRRIEKILAQQPEIVSYTSSIGDDLPRFYITTSIAVATSDFSQIMMRLDLERGGRFSTYQALADHLQREINATLRGPTAIVRLLESTEPKDGSVVVQVSGKDLNRIAEVAQEVQHRL
ncbi:efflux RND transporter permease subunit [Tunicatimonas pelagia]|uniref:efflux RND transporter permease subunit n=1 Tax=Tunicatimonas pelagia TaxID=931531 RepID=UPI00266614FB|nr:efflux RND transporter permease subunit [Tunicatimonas pelagia]WKN44970.1 efflux RND transporter permease subunit [Tunicatimonas pelagia]